MAALSPGTRLGTYEVVEPIGAGGMGEVYRARDTELGRDVAIKVLPDDFAEDEERVARFRREAQVLASLNHPNIAAIYGVESNALVLELVEGPTLADLIDRGPIPLDDAIAIARQITLALEAAHEAGVIHRDLKPANIKVQDDGTVKVLDFGLAKAIEGEADGSASESPTMTAAATRAGMIMGTAAYMSPEQARGKRVDRRADIWSFGVVVYEMLTGRRAFEAEDISLTLAEVMKSEPDWETLPSDLSPTVRIYLTQCLEKDPKRRVRDIGDVRLAIDGVFETSAPPPRLVTRPRIGWPAIAVALVLSAITGMVVWGSRPESPKPVARFVVNAPSEAPSSSGRPDVDVAVTPDGTRVVYAARFTGERELVVRDVNELETVRLQGLGEEKRGVFVSPDGNSVGYFGGGVLWKVSILGGPPVAVCDVGGARGASWGPDDTIIFATNDPTSGLLRVPASGGEPEVLTTPHLTDLAEGDHQWPEILPGGEAVLFTLVDERRAESAQIAVLSLDSGEVKVLLPGGSNPRYASTGHIVYGIGGALRAVGFDLERLEVTSAPIPVIDGVVTKASGAADFAISQSGSLVYIAGEADVDSKRTLVWVDRDGREEPLATEPRPYYYPRISPDGTRLALDVRDQDRDIWIWDFGRETLTRLTFDLGRDMGPTWSPDGRRVAFGSERNGAADLFWKEADGAGTVDRLSESGNIQVPQSFSPDGTLLVFWELGGSTTGWDLHVRRMDGDGGSEPLLVTDFNEYSAVISPDGRWLAYESDESSQREVYVRPFPAVDEGRWQVSRGGGTQPVWARDGRELFYLTEDGELTAVPIRADSTFDAGNPTVVFAQRYYVMRADSRRRTYDVSPDGKRFLMMKEGDPAGEVAPHRLILVQNWTEELKRLVPTDN